MNHFVVFLLTLIIQALQTACRSKGELVLERPGRRPIDAETRELIRRVVAENNWGAPRVH